MSTPESAAPEGAIPESELKLALKAFKKRLKLTRLDAESRIGVGPMSSGAGWGVVGIVPPNQYPRALWDELVKQGKLKNVGGGMYSLVDG
jgi:hypothetical protein